MSIVIDLPRTIESRVEDRAEKAGVTVHEYIVRVLEGTVSDGSENSHSDGLKYLLNRIHNPLTNPEEIEEAEADLKAFQMRLDENRAEVGDRLLFSR
jgi:hypothetical protein